MAYTITFYQCNCAKNVLDKTSAMTAVQGLGNLSCTPFKPDAELRGNVLLDYNANLATCNYCKIVGERGTQYCFILEYTRIPGNQMELTLEEDPLMTFKSLIYQWDINVDRCEKQADERGETGWNAYITDPGVKLDERYVVQRKLLHTFVWDDDLTLVTIG